MDNMIRVYEDVLSQEFCQKLIDKFEDTDEKLFGMITGNFQTRFF